MKRTAVFSSGKRAFDLISDPVFLQQMARSKRSVLLGDVYQSPEFVQTWYDIYREQFVASYFDDGRSKKSTLRASYACY